MAEVRRNAGTARLSDNTTCCVCGGMFIPGQEYAVDRAGHVFSYSHLGCRDGATASPPARRRPIPDVADADNGVAEIFYRGHHYTAVADDEGGLIVWGLFHPKHKYGSEPLAVERDPEVGLGGLVSWLLTCR